MWRNYLIKGLRKIYRLIHTDRIWFNESNVEIWDEEANNFVYNQIKNALKEDTGLMVCKFGTIELRAFCCLDGIKKGFSLKDYWEGITEKQCVLPNEAMDALSSNAGFFPNDINFGLKFHDLMLEDIKEIDILGSYIQQEEQIKEYLPKCTRINLNGYYAPFLWEHPWTRILEGKKVLVIHPFADSIKRQYAKREYLFDNPEVLPQFKELITIKAVQSIAGNGEATGFSDWFEALEWMENEIDNTDYDIALIGCGAYGFSLAAHIKRQGKVAVHLAGWTQMLFGIYGNRWIEHQPEFKKYINEYWVRPGIDERPKNSEKVEGGCYW